VFEPRRLCRRPSIRTLEFSDFRSVQVARPHFSKCCYLIIDLGSSDPTPRHGAYHFVVVSQWHIDFPAHPQLVLQHGQLPSHSNYGSFLGILFPSLG
jgi:hypothetical protein